MSRRARLDALLLPALTGLAALAVWQVAVTASHATTFPAPLAVARGFAELARRGVLLPYVGDSLLRVASGFGLALLVGVPVGLAMGWYPWLSQALNPVVQVLRPISPLAWIPVAIVLFGITNLATIFLIFLASLFPIVVASANGVRGVPRMYLQAGSNFGLPPAALFRRVLFPAALPQVLAGLRVALGVSWLVVVAAEMIAVDSGLGYLVIDARNAGKRYDLVIAAILLIGGIGLVLDVLARRIERLPRVRWGFRTD
jgi:NitT/TauT family transport system permease protein